MASDQVGGFPFFLPDGSIYSTHESAAQWIDAYCAMVKKIMDNGKLTGGMKEEKLKTLAEANTEVTTEFDSFHKIKLRSEMVKAGASVSPKSEASPSNQDLEHSENES